MILLWLLADPLIDRLQRVRAKYGLIDPPAARAPLPPPRMAQTNPERLMEAHQPILLAPTSGLRPPSSMAAGTPGMKCAWTQALPGFVCCDHLSGSGRGADRGLRSCEEVGLTEHVGHPQGPR